MSLRRVVMLGLPNSGVETTPAPSLGPKRAIGVFLAYFASQVATGVVVGVFGGVGYLLTHRSDPHVAGAQRVLLMPAAILGLIVGGMVALRMTRRSLPGAITGGALRSVGWSPATTRQLLLASTVGIALAFLYLFGLVPASPPSSGGHWGPIATAANAGGWPRHVWAVLALLVAPPVEEFVFRGVLFAGVRQSWTQGAAGVLVTFLFVAAHFSEIAGYAPATLALALVGAATLIARIATDSLAPAIALHASYNLGLVVAVYATAA